MRYGKVNKIIFFLFFSWIKVRYRPQYFNSFPANWIQFELEFYLVERDFCKTADCEEFCQAQCRFLF